MGHSKSNHPIFSRFPWWPSQILLKFGWNEPFCNRNKPWKFQLSIISDLEFICHWILCNFPIFGWSWANNTFMPNLSDNYILTGILLSLKLCTPVVFHPFLGSVLANSEGFKGYRYSKLAFFRGIWGPTKNSH